jgi:hypothetical protein
MMLMGFKAITRAKLTGNIIATGGHAGYNP